MPLAANHAAARRWTRLGGAAVALELREEVLAQQRVVAEPAALRVQRHDQLVGRRQVAEDPVRALARRRRRRTGRPTCGRGSPSAAGTCARAAWRGRGARRRGSRRCRCRARRRRPPPAVRRRRGRAGPGARRGTPRPASPRSGRGARAPRGAAARVRRGPPASRPPARRSARSSTPISTSLPFARRRATGSPPSVRPGDRDRDAAPAGSRRSSTARRPIGVPATWCTSSSMSTIGQPGGVERRGEPRDGERQRGLSVQRDAVEDRGRKVERAFDREADIAEEADRVGIGGVARHPRHGAPLPGPPQREARGLAVAGRRDHRHQAGVRCAGAPGRGRRAAGRHGRRYGAASFASTSGSRYADRRGAQRRGQGTVVDGARRSRRMSAPLPPVAQRAPAGHRPPASPSAARRRSRSTSAVPFPETARLWRMRVRVKCDARDRARERPSGWWRQR